MLSSSWLASIHISDLVGQIDYFVLAESYVVNNLRFKNDVQRVSSFVCGGWQDCGSERANPGQPVCGFNCETVRNC